MAVAAVAALAVGCVGDGEVDVVREAVAPAGSNALFVSNTIPTTLAPGERRSVTVTVTNTGTTPGFNDWTTSSPTYYLYRRNTTFGWTISAVPTLVPVGSSTTFTFSITAPATPGNYTFAAQMFVGSGGGYFGPQLNVPVTVSAAATPAFACQYEAGLSDVPTTIAPSTNRTVTVAVRNVGTSAWTPASSYILKNRTSSWNRTQVNLPAATNPGEVALFTFSITAPTTTGTTPFTWDMFQIGGIGLFGQNCVNLNIDVNGTADLNAALVSHTIPATMAPGEVRSVSITLQNTGAQTWTGGTSFILDARHSPASLFGSSIFYLASSVSPGNSTTFTFPFTAPSTVGSYTALYQMRKLTGTDAGFFGDTVSAPVMVDGMATPALDCAYVAGSSTVPTSMIAGSTETVTVTLQNTGSATWSAGTVRLSSANTPSTLWGTTLTATIATDVAPGATGSVSFAITAPTTPGVTQFDWWGRESPGAGNFQQCVDLDITVTDAVVDLAAGASRTLSGGGSLAPVTLGDVNDDDVPDVLVARTTPAGGGGCTLCGVVYGFIGGAGFFTDTDTPLPSDAAFAILGAEDRDGLGEAGSGNIVVGDLTGDGVEDIVVGAPGADGPANARDSAGEVYVIEGGLGLSSAGTIDLGAMTPPTQLVATIQGATAGDRLVPLAVADLTGDSVNDLVLGAPQSATGASTIGVVYVVVGDGGGLPAVLDLAAPGAVVIHTIVGDTTDTLLGNIGVAGDFMGTTTAADLLLGSSNHAGSSELRNGAVYAFAGPITGDMTLGDADVTWLGRGRADGLGASLAIANVRGTTRADVILGSHQYREVGGGPQTGAALVFDGPIAAGTYDLALSMASVSARVVGAEDLDAFGVSMRTGDVDGNGWADLIVDARAADGPGNTRSRAGDILVIRGGPTLSGLLDLASTPAALVIYGPTANGLTGGNENALAADDIDGDGRVDICAGTPSVGRVDCVRSPF